MNLATVGPIFMMINLEMSKTNYITTNTAYRVHRLWSVSASRFAECSHASNCLCTVLQRRISDQRADERQEIYQACIP